MYELYQKQVEAWKERFNVVRGFAESPSEWSYLYTKDLVQYPEPDDLLSSRHKDTIELLEAEIKRKRGKILMLRGKEVDNLYNAAIKEDIAYLEEQLKLIKKEI